MSHPVTKFLSCMPLCKSGILAEWGNGMNVPYNSQCSIHQNPHRRTRRHKRRHNPSFTIKTKVTQVNWKKKKNTEREYDNVCHLNMIHPNGHTQSFTLISCNALYTVHVNDYSTFIRFLQKLWCITAFSQTLVNKYIASIQDMSIMFPQAQQCKWKEPRCAVS